MRLGHSTPQPSRIVGKEMKAAEANPPAYVTSREVPSAWRTRATQPTGHTTAATTTVATLVPGSTSVQPGNRPGRDPCVEAVGIEGRVGDREVAGLEEGLDAAQVVDGVGRVDELVRAADRRAGSSPAPARSPMATAMTASGRGRPSRRRAGRSSASWWLNSRMPSQAAATVPAVTTTSGSSPQRTPSRAATRRVAGASAPSTRRGRRRAPRKPRAPRALTTSQPGRKSTTHENAEGRDRLHPLRHAGHCVWSRRFLHHPGQDVRWPAVPCARHTDRKFARLLPVRRTGSHHGSPHRTRRGGVGQAPGVRSYAARRLTCST